MPDFTSSLYLGMLHPSSALSPWAQLTTGAPAALRPSPGTAEVAAELARLQQCERATLRRSTLHAFWDLFGSVAATAVAVLMDRGSYPVVQWGVERGRGRRVPVSTFAHHDPADLVRRLNRLPTSSRPVVVTDGYCPGCGGTAPLRAYRDLARGRGGFLVLDDTQALGIFGRTPGAGGNAAFPYGSGGGGSVPWTGIAGPDVVAVSSLAKAFGAPLAAVAGSASTIQRLDAGRGSDTTVYSSPPSAADLAAARWALDANRKWGDRLRRRLFARVSRLRRHLEELGLTVAGGPFPVQAITLPTVTRAVEVHRRLLEQGVQSVLARPRCRTGVDLTFIVTARHRPIDIDQAAEALEAALSGRARAAAS